MFFRITTLLVLFLAAIPAPSGEIKPVLHVFTWPNVIAPAVVDSFEEQNNCTVEFGYFESDEVMMEKLREGGGYDVVTPAGFSVDLLRKRGALAPLDHALLPNLANLLDDPVSLAHDPERRHSVPFMISVVGVGYYPDLVPADIPRSWGIFADKRLAGKVAMMADTREAFAAALKFGGHSANSTDPEELAAAADILREWRRNVDRFGIDEARFGLADGVYVAVQGYYGDIAQIMGEDSGISFFIPDEGAVFSSDRISVCSDSEHPLLAHAFINHLLDPAVAARNMEAMRFLMPNKEAVKLMGERLSHHPALTISPELKARCETFSPLTPQEAELYDRLWTKVLVGD